MTDYLFIECIISELVQNGIIAPPKEAWKKTVIGTQYYFADFFRAESGRVISLRISIINEKHLISTTAFINQAAFFNLDPAKAIEKCKQ